MNVVKVVILEYSHYKVLNSLFDHTLAQKPYQWCCTVQEILLNLLTFCKFQLFALLCQYCCHGKPFLLSTHSMFRIAFFHHNNLTIQNMVHVYCCILCYTFQYSKCYYFFSFSNCALQKYMDKHNVKHDTSAFKLVCCT